MPAIFTGDFGRLTPCFTDVVVLGTAHLTAIVLCSARLAAGLRPTRSPRLRLSGAARVVQGGAVALSALCMLVVLLQLNARIAADSLPLTSGAAAPFEWAGARAVLVVV